MHLNLITAIAIVRCLLYHFRASRQNEKDITESLNDPTPPEMERYLPKHSDRIRINSRKSCLMKRVAHTCEFHQT